MKATPIIQWFVVLTLGAASLPSLAADRAFVGKLALAVSEEGAKRLELSAESKQKLLDLIDKRERDALSLALSLKDVPPEQRDARLAPFVAESERQGLALLTVEQRSKLDQLRIAQDGMGSLLEADIAKVIGLSEEQRKTIDGLMAERQQALTRGGENDRRTVRNDFERKLAGVLSQEQRANWEKLAGLAAGEIQRTTGASKDEPLTPESSKPASPQPTVAQPNVPQSTVPQPAVAATTKSTPTTTAQATTKPTIGEPARIEDGEILLRFNFQHAPWKDVLEWFAEQSELALQADILPTGTCNYRDKRSFTPAEGIDLINSMLLTKGFTLVRYQRLLTVLNLEDPIPPQLVELVPLSELNERGDFELIKCLFPLSKMETSEAEAEVAKLIGPQGSIVSLPKSRQILVTETAGRLRTIREVISAVEDPNSGQLESIREVSLKHVGVEEFLTIARPLLGLPEGQNQSADIRLSLDPFSPRIFATGITAALKRLDEIVLLADRPSTSEPGGVAMKPLEQPYFETYPIGKADPATVLQVVQTLLAGLPDVRLQNDPVNSKLYALARPSEHRTIVETLKQLEGNANTIEVIQLRKMDPQLVILSINKMFGNANEKDKTADAPKVDGDPTSMKLWVRGSTEQIAQIKDLVEKMEGPLASEQNAARQPLRFLPVPGNSARSTLDSIEAFWPTMRENKIRVVTPSAISTTLRQQTSGGESTSPTATPALPPSLQLPPGFQYRLIPNGPPADSSPVAPQRPSKSSGAGYDSIGRGKFHFVSFNTDDAAPADESQPPARNEPAAVDAPPLDAPAVDAPAAPDKPNDLPEKNLNVGEEKPEILVTVTPQGIFIASKDLDALDDFEKLMRTLVEQRGTLAAGEPTVFWLKFSKADVAAELLNQIINGAGADSSGGGGSLLGDMASSMLGDAGGMLGGLLGGGGGGSTIAPGSTTIVPDVRLNCLIVQGRPQHLMLIEQLLPIIDREASPEEVLTTGKPRLIPVVYMSADEMANIVKQVFADRVAGAGGGNQRQQQPSPEEFINALRGRSGRGRNESKGEIAKMTVGVDPRSNSLIVAASEPLFREVEALVLQLDLEGSESNDSMQVVTIRNSNPAMLQKVLNSITGGQVKANTQTAATSSSTPSSNTNQTPQPGGPASPFGQSSPDDIRRRIEMFRSMQQGGGGPGGSSGGRPTFSFGPGGFGGFGGPGGGGDRGGGDRGGGDRGGGDRGGGRGGRN